MCRLQEDSQIPLSVWQQLLLAFIQFFSSGRILLNLYSHFYCPASSAPQPLALNDRSGRSCKTGRKELSGDKLWHTLNRVKVEKRQTDKIGRKNVVNARRKGHFYWMHVTWQETITKQCRVCNPHKYIFILNNRLQVPEPLNKNVTCKHAARSVWGLDDDNYNGNDNNAKLWWTF